MRGPATALLLLLAAAAPAAERAPSAFVAERQDRMRGMEDAVLALDLLARGLLDWNATLAARLAAEIATLSGGMADLFADTPASRWGPASRASQQVWRDPGAFLVRAADLEARAFALIATVRGPDGAALLPGALADLRASCTACHDRFLRR